MPFGIPRDYRIFRIREESEPGFSGFVDFQDWSLVYCSPFHRMTIYCCVVGEWHKLESLCYEERAGRPRPYGMLIV